MLLGRICMFFPTVVGKCAGHPHSLEQRTVLPHSIIFQKTYLRKRVLKMIRFSELKPYEFIVDPCRHKTFECFELCNQEWVMAWEVKHEITDKNTFCMRVFYELQWKIRGSVTKRVYFAFSFVTREPLNIMLTSLNNDLCPSPKQNLGGLKFQYVCEVETLVAQWVIIQYIGFYQLVLANHPSRWQMLWLCRELCGKVVA
jgi:hypothetical protein